MDNMILCEPNDVVAIICKRHDNDNNTYIINPISVALGKINDENMFVGEDDSCNLPSIDEYKFITSNDYDTFYGFSISIYELQDKYPNTSDITSLMYLYFKDIASKISIALKDKENGEIRLYNKSYRAISPEIGGEVTKVIDNEYDEIEENDYEDDYLEEDFFDPNEVINLVELENYLKDRIFDNDATIEDICTTIAMNFLAKDGRDVEAILSVGPTGSGKTETFKLIAEYLGIPITIYDCNSLTASGYVGKDIEDVFNMILLNSGGDLELAERSILVLDEIDKIASKGSTVGDIEVQNSLLKVLDGHKFDIEVDKRTGASISFDSSFLTIVGLGAFPGLFEAKKPPKHLGFGEAPVQTEEEKEITTEDFVKFGMLAELMGRFHNIHFYKELDKDALKRILVGSKNSPLIRKAARLKSEFNTELTWDDEFIDTIAEYAYKKKAGGRSLNKVISNVLKKVDRELLLERLNNNSSDHKLVLTKKIIEDNKSFKM